MSAEIQKNFLQFLRKNGSDVTKPHEFEFFVYLPTRASAKTAATKILKSGFAAVEVSKSDPSKGWLCTAKKSLVPKKTNLADHARVFEEIAAALNGSFDGWEVQIE